MDFKQTTTFLFVLSCLSLTSSLNIVNSRHNYLVPGFPTSMVPNSEISVESREDTLTIIWNKGGVSAALGSSGYTRGTLRCPSPQVQVVTVNTTDMNTRVLFHGGLFQKRGTQLYPESTLGTTYVIVSSTSQSGSLGTSAGTYDPGFIIIASQPDTVVNIFFTVNGSTTTDPKYGTNGYRKVKLGLREQHSVTASGDVTGTLVQSDKPVAVFVTDEFLNPVGDRAALLGLRQLLPTETFGQSFALPALPSANTNTRRYFRVVTAYDGTDVNFAGLFQIRLASGQFFDWSNASDSAHWITSSKPITTAAFYNNGTNLPFTVIPGENLFSREQFLGEFIASNSGDVTLFTTTGQEDSFEVKVANGWIAANLTNWQTLTGSEIIYWTGQTATLQSVAVKSSKPFGCFGLDPTPVSAGANVNVSDNATACRDYTYGYQCTQQCGNCHNNAPCDKHIGVCYQCQAGWKLPRCKTECNDGTYGSNCFQTCGRCQSNASCNKTSGYCPRGCETGYQGNKCDTECNAGTYGPNCANACGVCQNNEACDRKTGQCPRGCDAGFYGGKCDTACPDTKYGINCLQNCGSCRNGVTCNGTTGHCPDGCQPGYHGVKCQSVCTNGTYGDNCKHTCGFCQSGRLSCNRVSGTCPGKCDKGFRGQRCDTECMNGTYGSNCEQPCGFCRNGMACNKVTGKCTFGCDHGYSGDTCEQALTGPWTFPVGIGVGAAILLVVIIIVVIIVVVVMRRRKRSLF